MREPGAGDDPEPSTAFDDEPDISPRARPGGGQEPEKARPTLSDDGGVGRKFHLITKLAERSDVVIYDAEHTGIGRRVELHMLPIELPVGCEEADRLIHAARAGARVAHRRIRSVVDSGVDTRGRPFIVYEPLDGLTASAYVAERGDTLDVRTAAELTCQLLEALACAHAGGVVHRQVNAEHVIIAEVEGMGPQLKLGGFGHAFLCHRPEHVPELPTSYSPYYAPELRRGEDSTSPAVDIFAAGVVMRLLMTGDARPGRAVADVAARAIERATADDPDERFQSAEQFLAAVGMLVTTRERPGATLRPPGDPDATNLTADLRYLRRRNDGSSNVRPTQAPAADLELLPVLLLIEALYARLGDDGWGRLAGNVAQVVDLLPDSPRADEYAEHGVPASLVSQVLQAADQECGDGFLSLLIPLGESLGRRGLRRLCPSLPERLSPEVLVSAAPVLWRALSRAGTPEVQERHDRWARFAINGQAAPTLEVTGLFAAMLRGVLRQHGSPEAEVNIVCSQALGDAADICEIRW